MGCQDTRSRTDSEIQYGTRALSYCGFTVCNTLLRTYKILVVINLHSIQTRYKPKSMKRASEWRDGTVYALGVNEYFVESKGFNFPQLAD